MPLHPHCSDGRTAFAKARAHWATNRRKSAGMRRKVGARLGRGALTTVSGETERHPFFALAVAIGIGVLIGMVSKSRH